MGKSEDSRVKDVDWLWVRDAVFVFGTLAAFAVFLVIRGA